ncbi:MAG: hypothetical protein FJ272_01430, partial [Planctomycetes bacterium]|nr:hypothetical protein [Planctomycetota bacterium]
MSTAANVKAGTAYAEKGVALRPLLQYHSGRWIPIRMNVMSRQTAIVVLVVFLGLSSQAAGQQVEKVGDFFRITTDHYVIETDVSLDFAWEMARHMEEIFREYSNQMKGFSGHTPAGFNVRVFQKRVDYAAHVGSQYRNTSGIYMPSRKLLAAYMEDQPPNEVLATLYHEGFHQF